MTVSQEKFDSMLQRLGHLMSDAAEFPVAYFNDPSLPKEVPSITTYGTSIFYAEGINAGLERSFNRNKE